MPALQKNGRIRLSGAEQVAIIIARSGFKRNGVRETTLPSYMYAFQKKHGGYFRYNGNIKFVVVDRRKFLAQLRKKLGITKELREQARDLANYEALLHASTRGKGLKSPARA